MKKNMLSGVFILITIFGFSVLNCSPSDNAKVTIHIDLGLQEQNAYNSFNISIIDRVFRFFAKDAEAQVAPSGITSISLAVSGEGMATINETYSGQTSIINLEVPAGPSRAFQVTAYIPTGNYSGSATQDLTAGQSVDIPISMAMQYANVTINPVFPAGIPAALSSYIINVTTSGQPVLSSQSFSTGEPVQVPAGDAKDFEVLISTPSVTFRGTESLDLTADSSVSITPSMSLYKTKIVIPDYGNDRIVQIDEDFYNPDWKEIPSPILGYLDNDSGFIYPRDIDFDPQGRIYLANDSWSYNLLRFDSIESSPEVIIETLETESTGQCLAIDRNNSLIYISDGNSLFRSSLDGNIDESFTSNPSSIDNIIGLAVDNDGYLYISGIYIEDAVVVKYNPLSGVESPYNIGSGEAWDVMVKSSYVYIANFNSGGTENKIIRQNLNLTETSPAILYQDETDRLYGPHRFLAMLNSRFYVIDDGYDTNPPYEDKDRIISFENINDTYWQFYGSTGSEIGRFRFFDYGL